MIERRRSCLALLLLVTAACAAAPPPAAVYRQALVHNERGVNAERTGDRARARAEFAEALRLAGSIEHEAGMTINLLNLARVCRRQGDSEAASAYLERAALLVDGASPYAGEIAFERARLAVLAGDPATARTQVEQALASGRTAARLNLHARILLQLNDRDGGAEAANAGLAAAEAEGNRAEAANAARLLGDVAAGEGRGTVASDFYRRALAIDKELGDSGRIAADLRTLGRTAAELGQLAGAVDYWRRAAEVSRQARDRENAALALREACRLLDLQGKAPEAGRLRREADRLAAGAAD